MSVITIGVSLKYPWRHLVHYGSRFRSKQHSHRTIDKPRTFGCKLANLAKSWTFNRRFCPLDRFNLLLKNRSQVYKALVEFRATQFFISKKLSHSKVVTNRVRYRAKHNIELRDPLELMFVPPSGENGGGVSVTASAYDARWVRYCDNIHLEAHGVLDHEKKAIQAAADFNTESDELILSILPHVCDKLPEEWDGKGDKPETYTLGIYREVAGVLKKIFEGYGQMSRTLSTLQEFLDAHRAIPEIDIHPDTQSSEYSYINFRSRPAFIRCETGKAQEIRMALRTALSSPHVWNMLDTLHRYWRTAQDEIWNFKQDIQLDVIESVESEIPLEGQCDTYKKIDDELRGL